MSSITNVLSIKPASHKHLASHLSRSPICSKSAPRRALRSRIPASAPTLCQRRGAFPAVGDTPPPETARIAACGSASSLRNQRRLSPSALPCRTFRTQRLSWFPPAHWSAAARATLKFRACKGSTKMVAGVGRARTKASRHREGRAAVSEGAVCVES